MKLLKLPFKVCFEATSLILGVVLFIMLAVGAVTVIGGIILWVLVRRRLRKA